MTHKFNPGDRAIIVRVGPNDHGYLNQTCEVISPLSVLPLPFDGFPKVHEIMPDKLLPGHENATLFALPSALRPIDGDTPAANWEDCAWRPKITERHDIT